MFGSTASNKPAFGTGSTGFGASTGFGFGKPANPATSAPAFGFGSTTATTSAPAFNFGTATTTQTSSFGFGTATTSAPAFNFGTSTSSTGFGAATSKPAFGFGTQAAPTATSSSGFGFGFAANQPAATGFGTGGSLFGKPTTTTATATAPQVAASNETLVYAAVHMPVLFKDERDGVINKWNQLQAFWGTGTGFVSQNSAAKFSPENLFCYFKAIGYSFMPTTKDEDGLVGLLTKKSLPDLENNQQASVNFLTGLLCVQPTLSVCVDSVRELPDKKTEMVIYLQERLPNGTVRKVSASLLHKALCQSNVSTQLKNAGVEQIIPKASMSAEALQYYLDTPPAGIDRILWDQAKKDNPDPENLLPVPMVGFSELHKRLKYQEQQCSSHQARLNVIEHEIKTLQQKHATTVSRIEEYKRRYLDLSHRVLKVIVKQETHRKMGYGILAEEEQLRIKLETVQQELDAPTQFKSRLSELLSQIRLQNQTLGISAAESQPVIDDSLMEEIKSHLQNQQRGLQELITIIKDDIADLGLIEAGYIDDANR